MEVSVRGGRGGRGYRSQQVEQGIVVDILRDSLSAVYPRTALDRERAPTWHPTEAIPIPTHGVKEFLHSLGIAPDHHVHNPITATQILPNYLR
jgi:hypothetical protein